MSKHGSFEAWFETQHITIEDSDKDIAFSAWQAARVQALEDVIRLCDPDSLGLEQGDGCATGVYRVEKAIRALMEKEPT